MPQHPFEIVDVFTDRPFQGNQLAVVTDARGLTAAQMQAIAREFNFAETSFLLPPGDPANDAALRIFTPTEEMPFAGHPNVGTAFVVGRMGTLFGRPVGDRLLFEEQAGLVELRVERDGATVTGARCRAPRRLALGAEVSPAVVAALASLDPADIRVDRLSPRFASVGAEFLLAEVSAEALERAAPDPAAFAAHQGRIGQSAGLLGLHLHVRDPADPARLDVRMFAPLSGVTEDAATGSAAAVLGAVLAVGSPRPMSFTLTQGRHIGRPSVIAVEAGPDGVWIGGPSAPFARGVFPA